MNTALIVVTLLAAPGPGPQASPPTAAPRVRLAPRQVPPLRWERIIKKCGAPCLVWARHILDAATSPHGFRWQIKALAQAARQAHRAGRLRPAHARKIGQAIAKLAHGLKHFTRDGLLTHRERMVLLRGIIRTGAALHRATRVGAHLRRWPPNLRRLPPPAPPAPPRG